MVIFNYQQVLDRDLSIISAWSWFLLTLLRTFRPSVSRICAQRCHAEYISKFHYPRRSQWQYHRHFLFLPRGGRCTALRDVEQWPSPLLSWCLGKLGQAPFSTQQNQVPFYAKALQKLHPASPSVCESSRRQSPENLPVASIWFPWISSRPLAYRNWHHHCEPLSVLGSCPSPLASAGSVC